jgi:hypothetical protein
VDVTLSSVDVAANATQTLTPVQLTRASSLRGQVISLAPEVGVQGRQVELIQNDLLFAVNLTGETGDFEFTDIVPGAYILRIVDHNGVSRLEPIDLAAGEDRQGLTLTIRPGGSITGLVSDSNSGAPLPRVLVTLRDANGLVRQGSTDEAGMYRFDRLALGAYTVALSQQGPDSRKDVQLTSEDGQVVSANLQATFAARLHGLVLTTAGEPLAGHTVRLLRDGEELGTVTSADDGQ